RRLLQASPTRGASDLVRADATLITAEKELAGVHLGEVVGVDAVVVVDERVYAADPPRRAGHDLVEDQAELVGGRIPAPEVDVVRSEEHTSELQSRENL